MSTPEIRDLRRATEHLTEQVSVLSAALTAVGTVQAQQGRQMDLAVVTSSEQRDLSSTMLTHLDDLDTSITRRTRLLFLRVVALGLVVLALLFIVVTYVHDRDQRLARVCRDRNAGAVAIHDFIEANRNDANSRPSTQAEQQVQALLGTLEKGTPIVNC